MVHMERQTELDAEGPMIELREADSVKMKASKTMRFMKSKGGGKQESADERGTGKGSRSENTGPYAKGYGVPRRIYDEQEESGGKAKGNRKPWLCGS